MGDTPKKRSGLARYWPVIAVAVVVVAAIAVGSVVRGGGDDEASDASAATSSDTPPALAAFSSDEDPMDAPDCDPDTGRLAIPTLLAPNCVPIWPEDEDNGGDTYPGVTGDEIIVAHYNAEPNAQIQALGDEILGPDAPTDEENDQFRQQETEAYNALYETYGRTVKLVEFDASGPADDDAAARADAIHAADDLDAFAVIGGPAQTNAFAETLADKGVICVCLNGQPNEVYEDLAPYGWGITMSSTDLYVHRADFVANRLAGEKAEFAGDPAYQDEERTFAIVYFETADGSRKAGVDFFEDQLAGDGVELTDRVPYILDLTRAAEDSATIVARLKDKGVTSVIFAGDGFFPIYLTAAATQQDYNPEWIITGSLGTDVTALARRYDQKQWAHAFGISGLVARVDPDTIDQEENPVSWYLGEQLEAYPNIFDLGLVFSGIHLAGPNLTPDTFRDGLFSLKPASGYSTVTATSFGTRLWPDQDYTGVDDVTEIWWDADATGQDEAGNEGTGMYRYQSNGERYLPGKVGESTSVPFDEADTITMLETRPAADTPPDYPPRRSRTG
jgi:hypothetical protein